MSPFLWATVTALIVLAVTNLSTTIYLHRGITHRSMIIANPTAFGFRLWLWLFTGIRRQQWVAVHRKHHAMVDSPDDPHSPAQLGWWRVQLYNAFYYLRETRNPKTIEKYTKDLPYDWADRFLLFKDGYIGSLLGMLIFVLIFGVLPGIYGWLLHGLLYVMISGAINGICHWFGYKNFPEESATNVQSVAYISAGEGLHNNHHGKPSCPKLSMRRGERDPAWWFIRLLARLGQIHLRMQPYIITS